MNAEQMSDLVEQALAAWFAKKVTDRKMENKK